MNRLAKWMMRLYPAAWRARYGDEMDALLADSGADAKTVADLLTGGIRMRFSGSFLKLAAALAVAGMILGLGASYLLTPQYVSKATLLMTPAPPMTTQDVSTRLVRMIQREQQRVTSRTKLAAIINDPRLVLYKDERKNTPLEDVINEMRDHTLVEYAMLPEKHSAAFNIRFIYQDRFKAQQAVSALMNAFIEQNQEMQRDDGDRSFGAVLQVLDGASLPVTAASPDRLKFALFGCLLGFLLACGIAVVRSGGHSPSAPMLATNE